jgi:hypothetical protein
MSTTTIGNTAWALWSNTRTPKARRNGRKPRPYKWDYAIFSKTDTTPVSPGDTKEFIVVKHNGALDGFNQ